MSDTRPGELSRQEAQRIAQETASLLRIADNEREYREHVLVQLARMEVKQDSLQDSFERHVDEDDRRFGNVTQKIGENSAGIAKGVGVMAAVVVMLGVIMWFIDKLQT